METIIIENVKITKQDGKLSFYLPSDFDGLKFKAFKVKYEKEIKDFKNR